MARLRKTMPLAAKNLCKFQQRRGLSGCSEDRAEGLEFRAYKALLRRFDGGGGGVRFEDAVPLSLALD